MNKIIALTLAAGSLAVTSAFGQGYIILQSNNHAVTDSFTTPGSGVYDTKVDVALLISTSTSATPTVEGLFNGTATSGTLTSAQDATAWSDIQNDANFAEAVDASVNVGAFVVSVSNTKGAVQYASAQSFGLNGTGTSANYSFYEVSWNGSAYSTLAAAEAAGGAANDAIGWSQVLGNFGPLSGAVNTVYPEPQFNAFGTLGVVVATPEPSTMALAGLGGLSLLAFRRKK